ncbi:hypothetical protein FCU94_19160 [Vibrio sp. JPW-9-11-11]|uniref:hypothetical protein n=1 Tax=Vibrio sp. JPW-9-11-11 TaxID=1416532 RepID=UPI001592B4E0|nr:hypothetical protein [Vibrio sp. JPW-9-11-11]NVD08971.1 hypothetical protein [Vibrio sp. JPW-9-11-11]
MKSVLEIVRFKLNHHATHEQLIAACEQSQKFVSGLDGFEYRSLSFDQPSNTWTDVVYWASMEQAQRAGEQFLSSPDCQPLMALIDPESVIMQHQTIAMSDLAAKYQ